MTATCGAATMLQSRLEPIAASATRLIRRASCYTGSAPHIGNAAREESFRQGSNRAKDHVSRASPGCELVTPAAACGP